MYVIMFWERQITPFKPVRLVPQLQPFTVLHDYKKKRRCRRLWCVPWPCEADTLLKFDFKMLRQQWKTLEWGFIPFSSVLWVVLTFTARLNEGYAGGNWERERDLHMVSQRSISNLIVFNFEWICF